eukprot:gene9212-1298_t
MSDLNNEEESSKAPQEEKNDWNEEENNSKFPQETSEQKDEQETTNVKVEETSDWNKDDEDQSSKFPQEETSDWNKDEEESSKFPQEEEEDQSSKFPPQEVVLTPVVQSEGKKTDSDVAEIQVEILPSNPGDREEAERKHKLMNQKPVDSNDKNSLIHHEGYLYKVSTEKTHAHKRYLKADKQSKKVELSIWKDKNSKETSPLQHFFFSESVEVVTTESFKPTKKSPTCPKDKEFKYCIKIKPSRGKEKEVVLWSSHEKTVRAWETALNDMVNLIRVEQAQKKAEQISCNIL